MASTGLDQATAIQIATQMLSGKQGISFAQSGATKTTTMISRLSLLITL